MIDRQEKLWLIRQQIAKAVAEVDHGDIAQSCLALANALGAMLSFAEAEYQQLEVQGAVLRAQHAQIEALTRLVEKRAIHPEAEEVKELSPDVRKAVDDLRSESTKNKRR